LFVLALGNKRQRRMAELYLARYPGFVIDGERFDYGNGAKFIAVKST
jgi:hypothetical protein